MKKVIVLISFLCGAFFVSAQQGNQQQRQQERWKPESTEWYHPVPPKVTPGVGTSAPSDAIILFDGKDLTKWEAAGKDGGSAKWAIKDGTMVVVPGSGSIRTKEYFGDCQLHIEFKTPIPGKDNTLQMKGNSGIMLQSRYEVQVLDCEDNPTYVNGWVGSVYKQSAPLANAFKRRMNGKFMIYIGKLLVLEQMMSWNLLR